MSRRNLSLAAAAAAACALAGPARAVKITEYAIPTPLSSPRSIAAGPDGRLWFAEYDGQKVGAITTEGAVSEYAIAGHPVGLAAIPGRALAFTEQSADGLGFVSVTGSHSESPGLSSPIATTFGPDGRIWIADATGLTALHYLANSPATAPFPLSGGAWNVVVGPDKRVWATEFLGNKIAACSPAGAPCSEYALPPGSDPTGIASGPDGTLWFSEWGTGKIGRMTTSGVLTEYDIPTAGSYPEAMCVGADGAVWFVEHNTSKVGRITRTGAITEYALAAQSYPYGIATGPDGNLWVTETTGKIAKLERVTIGDANGDGTVNVSDAFYLVNYLFAGGAAPK